MRNPWQKKATLLRGQAVFLRHGQPLKLGYEEAGLDEIGCHQIIQAANDLGPWLRKHRSLQPKGRGLSVVCASSGRWSRDSADHLAYEWGIDPRNRPFGNPALNAMEYRIPRRAREICRKHYKRGGPAALLKAYREDPDLDNHLIVEPISDVNRRFADYLLKVGESIFTASAPPLLLVHVSYLEWLYYFLTKVYPGEDRVIAYGEWYVLTFFEGHDDERLVEIRFRGDSSVVTWNSLAAAFR